MCCIPALPTKHITFPPYHIAITPTTTEPLSDQIQKRETPIHHPDSQNTAAGVATLGAYYSPTPFVWDKRLKSVNKQAHNPSVSCQLPVSALRNRKIEFFSALKRCGNVSGLFLLDLV